MTQTALESFQGALTQIAPLPPGIDANRLAQWAQRGKFNYAQVRAMVGAAFQSLNEERGMVWADMITVTPNQAITYMQGGAVEPAQKTNGKSRPKHVRGGYQGHMIDLAVWEVSIAGDRRTLEDMTEDELYGSIVGAETSLRDQFDQSLLTRFFSQAENLLGTTGYDVGFCDGSPNAGSGGPKYAPRKWNGKVFYEDHNHLIGVDSSISGHTYGYAVNQLAKLVGEHGLPLNSGFKALVSESDVSTIQGDIRYVLPVANVSEDRGGLTTGNIYFREGVMGNTPASGGRYIGSVQTDYGFGDLFSIPRIPTGYIGLYRPGAPFAPNNALAVRYRESTGFGARLKEIPDETTAFPIKEIDVEDEYGISTGKNREAGACALFANFSGGSTPYTDPTIS